MGWTDIIIGMGSGDGNRNERRRYDETLLSPAEAIPSTAPACMNEHSSQQIYYNEVLPKIEWYHGLCLLI